MFPHRADTLEAAGQSFHIAGVEQIKKRIGNRDTVAWMAGRDSQRSRLVAKLVGDVGNIEIYIDPDTQKHAAQAALRVGHSLGDDAAGLAPAQPHVVGPLESD